MIRRIFMLMLLLFAVAVIGYGGETNYHQLVLTEDGSEDPYIEWRTADDTLVARLILNELDANAVTMVWDFPAGSSTVVPGLILADEAADFGFFDADTQQFLAIIDDDGDSWVRLTFTADDTPAIEVGGVATTITLPGTVAGYTATDDLDWGFGTGTAAAMEWTTADANANLLLIDLPAGGATDVPVVLISQTDADFGYFNGYTQTTFAIEDTDGDSWGGMTFSADDTFVFDVGGTVTTIGFLNDVLFGVDDTGVDVTFYGATASVKSWWDESDDTWYFGADDYGPDVFVYGATSGDYLTFDASIDALSMVDYNLKLDDDAVLYFGTGTNVTTADGDFTVNFTDGATGYLTLTAVTAEDVFQIGDGTIATDVLIQNTTTAGAGIFWDDSGELWKFGADGVGVDVGFYGDTAGDFILFDESGDELIVEDIKINIMDDTTLTFGDADDVTIQYDEDGNNDLQITGTVGFDGAVNFGIDDTGVDAKFFGATAGDFLLFDESGDELISEDVTINLMDDTILSFGDGDDATIQYDEDGNDDLQITGAVGFDGAVDFASTATFTGGQTRKVKFLPKAVELDGTAAAALTDTGTDGQTNISVIAFDADGGVTGDDVAYISWIVPDGYVVDSARLNVCYTYSTAEDAADEAQFDFAVNAVAAGEALDAAGTALADQTTVIADASSGEGKLYISQYNIEVEDIAVDDFVTIQIAVDESASALANSGTLDVLYFEIEYESTE